MSQRIQLSRKKGWRLPEGAVSVARPTKWGNPYRAVREEGHWWAGDGYIRSAWASDRAEARAQAVWMFRKHLATRRDRPAGWIDVVGYPSDEEIVAELAGRDLACWCPLDGESCHADVLLELANGDDA
jgi:hypothetical protein